MHKVISKCKNDKTQKNEIGKVPAPTPPTPPFFKKTCPCILLPPLNFSDSEVQIHKVISICKNDKTRKN